MPSPESNPPSIRRVQQAFDALACRPLHAIVCCALTALAVSALFTAVRVPVPSVHDEFSYLLAADTFASGRLTNTVNPFWQHFESFHIIQQPSYASKYPPGQGILLAVGTLIGGHPIVGAWLATALAAAAVCWMLQGWVPNRWALLGGLLVALHGMIQVRWSLSYWGGGLPMVGGALMFGALPRIQRDPHISTTLLMAGGAILLAATRPFEGFLVGMCVATALLDWMRSEQRPDWMTVLSHVVIPAAALLWLGIAALGFYNLCVTGDPLKMPYQVHEAEYAHSPIFLWNQPETAGEYRHAVMKDFFTGWAFEGYQQQATLLGFLQAKLVAAQELGLFFLGGALALPLIMFRQLLARRRLYVAWLTLLIFFAAESAVPWTYPHYIAPVAPLLFLLVVEGMRYLSILPRQGHAWARLAVPAIMIFHGVGLSLLFLQYATWQPDGWQWHRARIVEQLENTPGKHLVLVSYRPDHNGHQEWVYNRANLRRAKIIWARQMGGASDEQLLRAFHNRSSWILDADAEEPQLIATSQDEASDYLTTISPAPPR